VALTETYSANDTLVSTKEPEMARQQYKNYHFEIITRSGGHVNTSAMGYNWANAQYNLRKQYPGCEIVNMWE
jgi:hypothetical protein